MSSSSINKATKSQSDIPAQKRLRKTCRFEEGNNLPSRSISTVSLDRNIETTNALLDDSDYILQLLELKVLKDKYEPKLKAAQEMVAAKRSELNELTNHLNKIKARKEAVEKAAKIYATIGDKIEKSTKLASFLENSNLNSQEGLDLITNVETSMLNTTNLHNLTHHAKKFIMDNETDDHKTESAQLSNILDKLGECIPMSAQLDTLEKRKINLTSMIEAQEVLMQMESNML